MKLKPFQQDALDTLRRFLEEARDTGDPAAAFAATVRPPGPDIPVPAYRRVPGLESVPYVCLRLPTGGGKTLLAAHSIAVAAQAYIERDYPVVLWLVPTNTIRRQTAEALKKTTHPYRKALDEAFGGRVAVFDIGDVTSIRPQDLTDQVCIVVGTIQTLRVTNTDGRKIYAHSESFEPHFTGVSPATPGLDRLDDGPNKGDIKFSFANLMVLHQPLIIMDEAHNARTHLTFEVLANIRPSCIVEFTATPDTDRRTGSNVLYRASAAEVKAAEMIKLPIILSEHPDWRAAVHDAVATRARLAETAKSDPRFIRPIALFQAESRDREVTVEVLKKHLIENEHVTPERIAIATGEQRELDGIDLFDPATKIEFVITVEALKEGWDCPFAYVFCSVANIRSATDVEQLLGRVLRMPYAERRPDEALNRAYAHLSSPEFGAAAKNLTDRLIDMGFEPDEAAANVEIHQPALPDTDLGGLFAPASAPVLTHEVDRAPDLSAIPEEERARITVHPTPEGKAIVTIRGDVSEALADQLYAVTDESRHEGLREAVKQQRHRYQQSQTPAQRGERFMVPSLCVMVQGELELAERELLLHLGGWNLLDWPAELSPEEFSVKDTAERWEIDIKGRKIVYAHIDQDRQLEIGALKLDWTDLQLSRWLDRQNRQDDIAQPVLLEFCRRAVSHLIEKRGFKIEELVRFKYQLAKALQRKIAECRQRAYERGYQTVLFAPDAQVEVSPDEALAFRFDGRPYVPLWPYSGRYEFKKPYVLPIGELKASGEEFDCAQAIDSLPQVKHWIRNLGGPGRHETSFWLPTSSDRFYPDFVAELTDGRILVVEYKGEAYATNDDSKEKRNIGELWEEKSAGRGLFLMAEKLDANGRDVRAQLLVKIAGH